MKSACRLLAIVAAVLTWSVGLYAQPATLNLCTARTEGNYHAAGVDIRDRVDSGRLALKLVTTNGSMDNLARLASGSCNAAIVQVDAYLVFRARNDRSRLDLMRPNFLYHEFAHLACGRASGIEDVDSLVAGVESSHAASRAVLSKSGFVEIEGDDSSTNYLKYEYRLNR